MLRVYPNAKQIAHIRSQFPSLNYSALHYLDNAATTQSVDVAIKAVSDYHYNYRSNIHRSDYGIGITASNLFEEARLHIAELIGASEFEIAFTAGTTAGLNSIARTIDDSRVVIITELEHHSNILPWIKSGKTRSNGKLVVVKATDDGTVSIGDWTDAIKNHPGAFCSFLTQSNLTGITLPWQDMIRIAKEYECEVLVDACQSIGHRELCVQKNNIDWAVFSGHKMYASTGVGVIFKRGGFAGCEMDVGGGTLSWCDFNSYSLHSDPAGVEAGTPNIAGVHSIGAAAKWIKDTTYKTIAECEAEFYNMVEEKGLFEIEELELLGAKSPRSVYSFKILNANPSDIAMSLGYKNVCTRAGHLCASPASARYQPNQEGVLRISIAPYNDENDCANLVEGLWKTIEHYSNK